ncbi:hypothetical protein BJ085DRAFT_37722 [Dimargaris cristalligena]|uniref:Uncharacterized protein n=1 Tax=Dimargaris cristalligena TaxID=215637 RepID=A0A4Q0A0J6_9FUNG|nr:hypothetical protein BJ085DRAFT_37722 [Dimargaris cristalligena]|eukprot:RKP38792.1 hypothetical protein BJ085DRAFT_37722 [Dimargaris cristalligena]
MTFSWDSSTLILAVQTLLAQEYNTALMYEVYQHLKQMGIGWEGRRLQSNRLTSDATTRGDQLLTASPDLLTVLAEVKDDWGYLCYNQLPAHQQYLAFPLVFMALQGQVELVTQLLFRMTKGYVDADDELIVDQVPFAITNTLLDIVSRQWIRPQRILGAAVKTQLVAEIITALGANNCIPELDRFITILQKQGEDYWSTSMQNFFYMVVLDGWSMQAECIMGSLSWHFGYGTQ